MSQTTILTVFVAVTAVAVVLQTLILAGIGIAVITMGKRVQQLQSRVNDQVLPMAEKVRTLVDHTVPKVQTLVDESIPKLQKAVTNLTESTDVVRSQADKIDGVVSHFAEVARNQASRMDVLATRTMERVDIAAATVQHTVTTPIRRVSAVVEGVVAGIGSLVGQRKEARTGKTGTNDEMFI